MIDFYDYQSRIHYTHTGIRPLCDASDDCIDAPEVMPGGSTIRVAPEPDRYNVEPFCTTRAAYRGIG